MRNHVFLSLTLLASINSYAMEEKPKYPDISPDLQKLRNEESATKTKNNQNPELPPPIVPQAQALQNIPQPAQQAPVKESSLVARGCNALINALTKLKEKSIQQRQPNNNRASHKSVLSFLNIKNLAAIAFNLYTIQQSRGYVLSNQYDDMAPIVSACPSFFKIFGDFDPNSRAVNGKSYSTCGYKQYSSNKKFSKLPNTYIPFILLTTAAYQGINWYQSIQYNRAKNNVPSSAFNPFAHHMVSIQHLLTDHEKLSMLKQRNDSRTGYPEVLQAINNAGAIILPAFYAFMKLQGFDHAPFLKVLGLQAASFWLNAYAMKANNYEFQQERTQLNNALTMNQLLLSKHMPVQPRVSEL